MPTTKRDLPRTMQRSPAKAQRTYAKAHDNAVREYGEGERAHRTAPSALKHSFEKVGDHWEPKKEKGPSDPRAASIRGTDARAAGVTAASTCSATPRGSSTNAPGSSGGRDARPYRRRSSPPRSHGSNDDGIRPGARRQAMLARASLGLAALARGALRPVERLLDHEGIGIIGALRTGVRQGIGRA